LLISQRIPYKWTIDIDAPEEVETLDLGDIYTHSPYFQEKKNSHSPGFVDEAQSLIDLASNKSLLLLNNKALDSIPFYQQYPLFCLAEVDIYVSSVT
jgi:hypothetical protein